MIYQMYLKNNPCIDCKDRTVEPNCHTTCEKYAVQREENKKRKEYLRGRNGAAESSWLFNSTGKGGNYR